MTASDQRAVTLSPGLVSTSADEVERVLDALMARREPLAALLGGGASSLEWRLRHIDPARQYIVVESTSGDSASAQLLARERVTFLAEFGGMHIEFTAERPQQVEQAGGAAIRLGFPAVTVSHQRRAHQRAQVPAGFPLRCMIPVRSAAVFEAQVMDISEGGVGLLVRAENITPGPGTVIKGCRIEPPEKGPILVDLEVRHCRPVALADGSQAQRWGCQFIDPSDEAKELIRLFASE